MRPKPQKKNKLVEKSAKVGRNDTSEEDLSLLFLKNTNKPNGGGKNAKSFCNWDRRYYDSDGFFNTRYTS
jgi:hypothetical protein